jgi:RNA polymerase sigma factor (sigma-70 family)
MTRQDKVDVDGRRNLVGHPPGPAPALVEGPDIAALWRRYHSWLRQYIATRVGETDAEDLTQDIFACLCQRSARGQVGPDTGAYLFGMARKLVAYHLRQKHRRRLSVRRAELESKEVSCEPGPEPGGEERIRAALQRMPAKAGEALRLKFLEELGTEEAARRAGCTVEVFYRRVYQGLAILREQVYRPESDAPQNKMRRE